MKWSQTSQYRWPKKSFFWSFAICVLCAKILRNWSFGKIKILSVHCIALTCWCNTGHWNGAWEERTWAWSVQSGNHHLSFIVYNFLSLILHYHSSFVISDQGIVIYITIVGIITCTIIMSPFHVIGWNLNFSSLTFTQWQNYLQPHQKNLP